MHHSVQWSNHIMTHVSWCVTRRIRVPKVAKKLPENFCKNMAVTHGNVETPLSGKLTYRKISSYKMKPDCIKPLTSLFTSLSVLELNLVTRLVTSSLQLVTEQILSKCWKVIVFVRLVVRSAEEALHTNINHLTAIKVVSDFHICRKSALTQMYHYSICPGCVYTMAIFITQTASWYLQHLKSLKKWQNVCLLIANALFVKLKRKV